MPDLAPVYMELRSIMLPYAERLICSVDTEARLSVDTEHVMDNKKPLWFGGVEIKKNYVSYHLMPVYVNPALLQAISPELKKRMQGKSCFNFKTADATLFQELSALTRAAFDDYAKRGYL